MAANLKLVCMAVACTVAAATAVAAARSSSYQYAPSTNPLRGPRWAQAAVGPAPTEIVRLTFVLEAINTAQLAQEVEAVSDPASPKYCKYWSLEEIRTAFSPSNDVVNGVVNWIHANLQPRTVDVSLGAASIIVEAPAAAVETAFSMKLAVFNHAVSGRRMVRAASRTDVLPTLPASLKGVEMVLGLTEFFETRAEQRQVRRVADLHSILSSGSNAPVIGDIMGNETHGEVEFSVFCSNGQPTGNPTNPCADVASTPQVTSFDAFIHPVGSAAFNVHVDVAHAKCANSQVRPSLACHINFTVPAYARTNVSIVTNYADGTSSQIYTWPTLWAPRPRTTTSFLKDRYNVPKEYFIGTNPNNSQAIVSFEEQWYSLTDLHAFFDLMGLPQALPSLVGYNNVSNPGGEATLDVQWVMGTGQGVPTTTWSFPPGDYILNWALAVSNVTHAPLVTSLSYGDTETGYQYKAGYGLQYIRRMDLELQKMALRGCTVLAGSGDAGWTNVGEMGNDLSNPDPTCTPMRAFYPSLSPWVTSMSSVFVTNNAAGETAVDVRSGRGWSTGGGFSNHTGVQNFQLKAVQAYLASQTTLPPAMYFNVSGRGYPDMATIGDNMLCIWQGAVFPLAGTSASGPVAAGLVALLNDARLNKGIPPLGHLNPRLYRWQAMTPQAFTDITTGRNNDGDIQPPGSPYPTFCEYGFPTAPGWDAVTGLGSPNFEVMVKLALANA